MLTARHCADDVQRFPPIRNVWGEGLVKRLMRDVVLADEESNEGPPTPSRGVSDRAAQSRVRCFESVDDRIGIDGIAHGDSHFTGDAGQRFQVRRQDDANVTCHAKVWTSTESTAGRSCTMASQESPPLAET